MTKIVKILDTNLHGSLQSMICQQVTLSGDAEWPKVADAVIEAPICMQKTPDFSVVPFRLNFMLFSEKNHVKALKNQWVLTRPWPSEHLSGATSRRQIMAPE